MDALAAVSGTPPPDGAAAAEPDQDKAPERSDKEKAEILKEARERYTDMLSRDGENREAHRKAVEFVYVPSKQWSDEDRERRGDRPCLSFPQLKQFVHQVANDLRQERAGIRVHPSGGRASLDTAQIIQSMIRGIEYESKADAAYDSGSTNAIVGGRGYWRVISEFTSPTSFHQRLAIKHIPDPMSVVPDLDYQEPDASDQNFCFVKDTIKKNEFERRWPKAKAVSWTAGSDQDVANWYIGDDEIVVADYYRRVAEKRALVMMTDGAIGWEKDLPKALPPGISVAFRRESEVYKVEWFVIGGGEEILEEHAWKGTVVPVIMCIGEEYIADGKRCYDGLITQAMDAQRLYNFEKSAKAHNLAQQPISPYLGPADAFAGYENMWKQAGTEAFAYLPYNQFDKDGRPIAKPERIMPPQVPTGWAEDMQASKQDMRSIIGMYENSLGMHGQEVSGRAILAREKQGDNSTFHFVDNASRAIALTGRVIVELIPHYYDKEREVTTISMTDERSTTKINVTDPVQQKIVKNDVTTGEYAVAVESGPSYATKREEVRDDLMALAKADPQVLPIMGDVIVGTMDFPGSSEAAERFKVMLPPQIQALIAAQESKQDPALAAAQAKVQQITQQAQQAVAAVQQQGKNALDENAKLKAQLAANQAENVVDLQKARDDRAAKMRELDIKQQELELASRKLDIEEGKVEGDTLTKAYDTFAKTGVEPEPLMQQMAPLVEQLTAGHADLQKALQQMAGQIDEVKKHATATRKVQFQFDDNGEPIGGTSTPMLQ